MKPYKYFTTGSDALTIIVIEKANLYFYICWWQLNGADQLNICLSVL